MHSQYLFTQHIKQNKTEVGCLILKGVKKMCAFQYHLIQHLHLSLASPKYREKGLNAVDDIWYLSVGISDCRNIDLKKMKEPLTTKKKLANMIIIAYHHYSVTQTSNRTQDERILKIPWIYHKFHSKKFKHLHFMTLTLSLV